MGRPFAITISIRWRRRSGRLRRCEIGEYPAEAFIRFSLNHGLLDLIDRPTWRTVIGGSRVYVSALAESLGRALTGRAAVGVKRTADGVDVTDAAGETRAL